MIQSSRPSSPEGRSPRFVVVLFFVVSQIIVFFMIVEVGARLLDPLGISYYPETARLLDEMIIEEPIGYRMPPGLEGRYHGVDVQINELGMRDRPVAPHKEPGEFRILVMGDSVMFSIGVEYEDSVPYQIERIANENAPRGRNYRTLNMGVPSYNTEQELTQLKELGLLLQPDAAVLLVVPNDAERKMWVFEKRSNLAADLSQRSYAMSLIYFVLRSLTEPSVRAVPSKLEKMEMAGTVRGAPSRPDPRFDAIAAPLSRISHELRRVEIPFLLVHLRNMSDELVEVIQGVAGREDFAVRSLNPWDDPRWQAEDPSDYRNSQADAHWNRDGCRLHAALLYELMFSAGLLD